MYRAAEKCDRLQSAAKCIVVIPEGEEREKNILKIMTETL